MKTWEYKTVPVAVHGLAAMAGELEALGAEGWELVAVANGEIQFKRDTTLPERIDVFLVTDPPHEAFPLGIQIVAVDDSRERWTVVAVGNGMRANKYGAWWIAGKALTDDFIFSIDDAKTMVARVVKEADELLASEAAAASANAVS